MYYALKHIHDCGWTEIAQGIVKMLHKIISDHKLNAKQLLPPLQIMLKYTLDNLKDVPPLAELDEELTKMASMLPNILGEAIMTARDVYINEGRRQGIQEGRQECRQEGRQQEMQQFVNNMLTQGLSDQQICLYAGITEQKLSELKEKILVQ